MARTPVMRTPLGRVRGLGSAKEGTDHFWRQRLTAVSNLPLVLFVAALLVSLAGAGHEEAVATLARPWVALPLIFAILSVTTHMRIGMQVVIEDYVHSEGTKVALLIANTLFCTAVAVVGGFSVLMIALGGA